ncbi:Beta-ketoacyl synthase protein [Ostertagia ostertagi]
MKRNKKQFAEQTQIMVYCTRMCQQNANAGCPGVGSEGAGKANGCAGCPNQGSCSTGQPPKPDDDIRLIQDRFRHIKHKILILSGKGGVGKSTVTSSLARALASDPTKQVAILDVDICGPSQPRMLGVEQEEVHDSADGWTPVSVKDNLMLMSIAFLLAMADVPANANAGCPGVGSEGAGKANWMCRLSEPGIWGRLVSHETRRTDIRSFQDRFRHIKHKILILSGKGGVGKSTVTSSLARALASDPTKQVAILDVDICGPSQPRMLGVEQEEVHDSADGWTPVSVKDNLMLMSIAFLLGNKNDAVIWRGARKNGMIKQFLRDVDWGEVDYLLIDTPPGTSDEHISLVQFLLQAGSLDGAIIVSTPQEVSLARCSEGSPVCHKRRFPILVFLREGICKCRLSTLPIMHISFTCHYRALDNGEDFFEKYPDSAMAKAFIELAKKIEIAEMHRVVITGMGAVTPYGAGVPLLRKALLLESRSALKFSEELGFMVGAIPDEEDVFQRWTAGQKREMSRASQLALLAAEEAITSSNAHSLDHTDTLVNIGTGVSDLLEIGRTVALVDKGQSSLIAFSQRPLMKVQLLPTLEGGAADRVWHEGWSREHRDSLCNGTSLHRPEMHSEPFVMGGLRRAIAGASEGCVNAVALASDLIVVHSTKQRDGFVLSEGVGLVLLERLQDALDRGAPQSPAEIMGYGISSDCYHISSPDPSGIGARLSMERAIKDAKISSSEVRSYRHLLAAAGAVEVIATVEAIREMKLPSNLNLNESDEDDGLALLRQVTEWPRPRMAVVNSFGFGGTNASIVDLLIHSQSLG